MTGNDFRNAVAEMADAAAILVLADALDGFGALEPAADDLVALVESGFPYNGADIQISLADLLTSAYAAVNSPG